MPEDVNNVNLAARGYHHGDLRAALVDTGMDLLTELETAEALSLREVARRVGVSATAVYRHFPDKAALLGALAAAGMERLGLRQRAAMAARGGGSGGFAATGVEYVRFAVENPALFRLIFASAPPVDLLHDDPERVGIAMRGLRANIAALMPAHLDDGARAGAALHAWGLVHGIAMLVLDRQVPQDWTLIEAAISGLPVGKDG